MHFFGNCFSVTESDNSKVLWGFAEQIIPLTLQCLLVFWPTAILGDGGIFTWKTRHGGKGQTFIIHNQQTIWKALPFVYTPLSNAWTTRALHLSLESQTEANHAKLHTTGPRSASLFSFQASLIPFPVTALCLLLASKLLFDCLNIFAQINENNFRVFIVRPFRILKYKHNFFFRFLSFCFLLEHVSVNFIYFHLLFW